MPSSKTPPTAAGPKPNAITGSVILRETSVKLPTHPGKKIVCVFGVMAVPEGTEIQSGHLVPLAGADMDGILDLYVQSGVSLKDIDGSPEYRGWRVDQLVTAPIWKV